MSGISEQNKEFLRGARKIYFVAMKEELDAESTSSEVVYTGVGKGRATRGIVNWIKEHWTEVEEWEKMRENGLAAQTPVFISIGTAGSGKHQRSDILLLDRFMNNGDSFIREVVDFHTLPDPTGYICASSDFFISEHNFDANHVANMRQEFDCLDMESFALANICAIFNFRFCAIKCISDGANDTVESFDQMLPRFRAQLNELVAQLD